MGLHHFGSVKSGSTDQFNDEATPTETTLLLNASPHVSQPPKKWDKPRGFLFMEIAIFSNVFLAGFDGTVTASTYALISSEFLAPGLASWITTSYLLASTAVQPLYGRFSDTFGRRTCLLTATMMFGLGCLGCAVSQSMLLLIIMRAFTGLGGGGLMTMATIVNSDLIPEQQRGMFQAIQNILHGFGSILGASLGGMIAYMVGWRYCFLLQVSVAIAALIITRCVFDAAPPTRNVHNSREYEAGGKSKWQEIDIIGAILLFTGLSFQLASMSLCSNDRGWLDPLVITFFASSVAILATFVFHERRTKTIPILPLEMMYGWERVTLLLTNIAIGITAYGYLFILPLFFQTVLLDTPSIAGLRMVPPALATPVGVLITGISMRFSGNLKELNAVGLALLFAGSILTLCLPLDGAGWVYSVFPLLGNLGQGIVYPSILFSFIRTCEKKDHAVATSLIYLTRSMGTVWTTAATSAIIQSSLLSRFTVALKELPGAAEAIEQLRHSISVVRTLAPELRIIVQAVYYDGCRRSLAFLTSVVFLAFVSSMMILVIKTSHASNGITAGLWRT